jgi:hypothetical protein
MDWIICIKISQRIVEFVGDGLSSLNVVVHCVEEAIEGLEFTLKTDQHQ